MHFSAFELVVKLISKFINQLKVKRKQHRRKSSLKIKLEPAGITRAAQAGANHNRKMYKMLNIASNCIGQFQRERERERERGATRVERWAEACMFAFIIHFFFQIVVGISASLVQTQAQAEGWHVVRVYFDAIINCWITNYMAARRTDGRTNSQTVRHTDGRTYISLTPQLLRLLLLLLHLMHTHICWAAGLEYLGWHWYRYSLTRHCVIEACWFRWHNCTGDVG